MLPHAAFPQLADTLTVRRAGPGDRPALERLQELDEDRLPAGTYLIAESDERPIAAVEVGSGRAVADPFERSAPAVGLLRLRAEQLKAAGAPRPAARRLRARAAALLAHR